MTNEETRFQCELKRLKTMADGSFDLTLSLPEYERPAIYELIERLASEPLVEVKVWGAAGA